MNRGVEREVQRRSADAAGQRAAEGFLKVAAAEGEKARGIREEKPERNLILTAAEFAVPVGGELIIVICSLATDGEAVGCRVAAGDQITIGGAAELIAFEVQELEHDGIDRGGGVSEECFRDRRFGTIRG